MFAKPSAAIFRQLIEHSGDPYYVVDPAAGFRLVYANAAALTHWGYTPADVSRRAVPDWDHAWTLEKLAALWPELRRQRRSVIETRHRVASGEEIPVEVTLNYFQFEDQEWIAGYFHDIRERIALLRQLEDGKQRLEQALNQVQASHQRYEAIFECSRDGILIADEHLRFHSANRQALAMLGYSDREILDLGVMDIHPPDRHAEVRAKFQAFDRGEAHRIEDWPVVRKDGSIFYADISGAVFTIAGHRYQAGFLRDVSERHRIQQERRRHQSMLERAEKIAHVGSWTLDLVRNQLHWSNEVYLIFELDPASFHASYEAFLDAIHPDDRERVQAAYEQSLADRSAYCVDHRLRFADGRIKYVRERGESEYDATGRVLCSIGTVQDVSAEKAAELHLAERQKELHTLLESVRAVPWRVEVASQRFIYIGPQIEALLGYPAAYWRRIEDWAEAIHPEDRAQATGFCAGQTAAGRDHEFEYRALTAAGRCVWIRDVVALLKDERGQVTDLIGFFLDVTEAKRAEEALRASEAQYRAVIETSGDGFWLVDNQGRLLEVNEAYCRRSGYSREDLVGRSIHQFEAQETAEEIARHIAIVLERGSDLFETRHRAQNGELWDLEISVSHTPVGGGRFCCFLRDITERKRTEAQLHLVSQVFKNTSEGILITDARGVILDVNDAYCQLMGYRREEMLGANPSKVRSDRHDAAFYQKMWEELGQKGRWTGEVWDRRKNGEVFPKWLSINAVYATDGTLTHYIGSFADISSLKQAESQLHHLAYYDALTGLPNRILFRDRLDQELHACRRLNKRTAVLFLDLDRFKLVNDTLGHSAGDELLIQVANRLQTLVRENDTVARLGGDEFILIARDIANPDFVAVLANKIIAQLSRPFPILDQEVRVGTSVGISLFPNDGEEVESLIMHADAAMYEAKNTGRGQYRFYDQRMNRRAHDHLVLENELYQALQSQQFRLYYQPQVAALDGRTIGVETLIRWEHPQGHLRTPGDFIAVAEETGLILPMGHWAVEEVCRHIREWRAAGLRVPPVALNLSARQFQQEDLVTHLAETLASHDLTPEAIELEITESLAMEGGAQAEDHLRTMEARGFPLAIDDFGTGYSSLSYLKRFPVTKLKIDRSFIKDLPEDPNSAAIVRATIQMAHALGIKVVAEGVESEAQRAFLVAAEGDAIQGYLISRPLPAAAFRAWIERLAE